MITDRPASSGRIALCVALCVASFITTASASARPGRTPAPERPARAALWVDPSEGLTIDQRDALAVIVAQLAARADLVRTQPMPPVSPVPAENVVRPIASRLDRGIRQFSDVEIEAARKELTTGLAQIREQPSLLTSDALPEPRVREAVLSLVHALALMKEEPEARSTIAWWWSVRPDSAPPGEEWPSVIEDLVRDIRSSQPSGAIRVEFRSPAPPGQKPCQLVLNGATVPDLDAVGAARHAVRAECSGVAGWLRTLQVDAGQTIVLRTAPRAEALVHVYEERWSWKENAAASTWTELAADLAFVLDLPVAFVRFVGRPGAGIPPSVTAPDAIEDKALPDGSYWMVVDSVSPNGQRRELARHLLRAGTDSGLTAADRGNVEAQSVGAQSMGVGDSPSWVPATRPWAWGTLGAGLAVVAGAAGLHAWHDSAIADQGLTPDDLSQLDDVRAGTIAAYSVGGALLATSLGLWVYEWVSEPAQTSMRVVPTPTGFGILATF